MGIPYTRTVVLLVVVVGGVIGGTAVTSFGTSEPLIADSSAVEKPAASDVAFEIRATLNNTGQTNVTKSLKLVMEGETSGEFTAAERTVSIPANGTTTVTLVTPPEALTSERYSYRLVVDEKSEPLASGNVTFDEPAFAVTDHRTDPVLPGETATVEVDVHNHGDFRGMQTVRLLLDRNHDGAFDDDETVATKAPLVQSEGNATLTLAVDTTDLEPGVYVYRIEGTDNSTRGTLTVDQPATFRLAGTTMSTNLTRGEQFTASVTVVNDGDVAGSETVQLTGPTGEMEWTRTVMLDGGESTTLEFAAGTENLTRGNYSLELTMANASRTESLRIREGYLKVADVTGPETLKVGQTLRFNATVRNIGDAAANQTVDLRIDLDGDDQPETLMDNQSIRLAPGEATTVGFTAGTANLTRGNYSLEFTTANTSRNESIRIREGYLKVTDVTGPETIEVDQTLRFKATVRNIGDAGDNQTFDLRIDLDGDDQPETLMDNQSVQLAPGEATTIEFTIPSEDRIRFDDEDLLGTHIYGVYGEDTNQTDVVVVEEAEEEVSYSTTTSSSSSSSTSDGSEQISRDVISQEKYGLYYDEVSPETQMQIDEIYQRQPFADGLVVTEVLTREEIARQVFGLDVKRNDAFNFSSIDIDLQQEIEATFDAQFESETGDRIESWDELAQREFGTDYESLNQTRQQTVQELYQEQFDH